MNSLLKGIVYFNEYKSSFNEYKVSLKDTLRNIKFLLNSNLIKYYFIYKFNNLLRLYINIIIITKMGDDPISNIY